MHDMRFHMKIVLTKMPVGTQVPATRSVNEASVPAVGISGFLPLAFTEWQNSHVDGAKLFINGNQSLLAFLICRAGLGYQTESRIMQITQRDWLVLQPHLCPHHRTCPVSTSAQLFH